MIGGCLGPWRLSRRIAGLALLNFALFVIVVAVFVQRQFGLSFDSLVLGPNRDRITGIANALGRDLDAASYDARSDLLAAYSRRYGTDFYLVTPAGRALAGETPPLPEPVLERMRIRKGSGQPPPDRAGPPPELPGGPGRGWEQQGPGNPGRGRGAAGLGPPGGLSSWDLVFLTVTRNPWAYWIGVRIPINGPQGERGIPAVLLLRASSVFNSNLFLDWRPLLWLLAALAAVALLCWWPFLHRIAHAIRRMEHLTGEIAKGRFDTRVIIHRRDELGHLGDEINDLGRRLEAFVKHQKRFLGDIAHELCAPIARIQFALWILEQKVEESQQTHLAVLRDEIQAMSDLVNELLAFSKAGLQPAETSLKPVQLNAVVQRAISHQLPGTGTIHVALSDTISVIAYEPYLLRAISNVLRNAVRYAGNDGPIVVTARDDGRQVVLSVSDCGPGLPEDSLDEIFEPFYRPEAARSRDSGGVGLGLAIVKSCVEACHGTVICRNRQPSGLEVTIALKTGVLSA